MTATDRCPLCERRKEESSTFCAFHQSASDRLDDGYGIWRTAFDGLTREEYYARLERLDETGNAVKEIIQHLRTKGAKA
jgi:hypothetical protein